MGDISVVFDAASLRGDFVLGASDLLTGNDLETSVLISLFTDFGWWADLYEADSIGCGVLGLRSSKHLDSVLLKARDYCAQALRWLVDDQVASRVDVAAAWRGAALLIRIVITQATGVTEYSYVWSGL